MTPLQRVLLEKVGREYGFENVLSGDPEIVALGSARHAVKVSVCLAGDGFQLRLSEGILAAELGRDHEPVVNSGAIFAAADIEQLSILLLRTAALAQALPNQAEHDYETKVRAALITLPKNGTEIERMVRQRIGQDTFRSAMLDYWGAACAVTGINVPQILRASHAKPWAVCATDAERLDVFNGFLLSANLDALFDKFLISFDSYGQILISSLLTVNQGNLIGLTTDLRLRWLATPHLIYLKYHRECFYDVQKVG